MKVKTEALMYHEHSFINCINAQFDYLLKLIFPYCKIRLKPFLVRICTKSNVIR